MIHTVITHHLPPNVQPVPKQQLLCWPTFCCYTGFFACCQYGMECPFGHCRSAVLVLSPPAPRVPPAPLLMVLEAERTLALCSTAQQRQEIWYITNTAFFLESKQRRTTDYEGKQL